MHKLSRQVRFSINPFLAEDSVGFNSFSSKPAGEGLGIFLELEVGLIGQVDEATGFVVNVLDIDEQVRSSVVRIFGEAIRENFRQGRHVDFQVIAGLLKMAAVELKGKFGKAMVGELGLKLNPFRKVAIDCEDMKMVYFSEKFEFAATHKLWNDQFSSEKNFDIFGKCANPTGHGHNYVVEVTVKMPAEEQFAIGTFEQTVDSELMKAIDHKNLNVDLDYFSRVNPTVENITVFAWNNLVDKFKQGKLHCVIVWENDKTFCTYYG